MGASAAGIVLILGMLVPPAGPPAPDLSLAGLARFLPDATPEPEPAPPSDATDAPDVGGAEAQTAAPAAPVVYSDGYRVRARVHRIGSFALLPLMGTQALIGRSLVEAPTEGKRAWHRGVAWGLGGLLAANTVTGVWNLVEARKDPHGRGRRLAHGLLMMAADAGFVSTARIAPDIRKPDYAGQRSRHRAVAFTSIGLATAGYLLMLFER